MFVRRYLFSLDRDRVETEMQTTHRDDVVTDVLVDRKPNIEAVHFVL
jgi:hypothetical protein